MRDPSPQGYPPVNPSAELRGFHFPFPCANPQLTLQDTANLPILDKPPRATFFFPSPYVLVGGRPRSIQ